MAVRKSAEESVVVAGPREEWLSRTANAMQSAGFRHVELNPTLFQVSARIRTITLWGDVAVTLSPHPDGTQLQMRATAAADNIGALFRSPTGAILNRLKAAL